MKKLLVLFLILLCATAFGATRQKTWITGDTITANSLNADWDNFYSEKITASNIANGAVGNNQLGTITTGGKINFTALTVAGQSQGDIIYFNGTNWTRLTAGTVGQALVTGGAGANPSWGTEFLGAWDAGAPWVLGNVYQATTDGFVILVGINGSVDVDTFTPPTTVRGANGSGANSSTITAPVAKDEYWQCNTTGTIYWKPLGN